MIAIAEEETPWSSVPPPCTRPAGAAAASPPAERVGRVALSLALGLAGIIVSLVLLPSAESILAVVL
ncbi:hypothetical protein [Streptomyces lutosisoli]|uniref:Uncharacterized protein n=1 Tax=Streptomyces lutosisoli TaxID=2665721 RepID=A0ABW2VXW7_9ACTN